MDKTQILNNIGYTPLVYSRINKKLNLNYTRAEIQELIFRIISDTPPSSFERVGKNFYIYNEADKIRVTVNTRSYRVITVDRLEKIRP